MTDPLTCEYCNALSNSRDGMAGNFERWVCSSCGALRYWAPCCNQGWLVRGRLPKTGEERYVCEECETVFAVELESGKPVTNLRDWLSTEGLEPLWTNFEQLKETTAQK